MTPISQVLIVGGTHGNEMTGIQLVKNWLVQLAPLQRPGLRLNFLLANLPAIQSTKRYVDFDLNRAFRPDLLDPSTPALNGEVQRAREINSQFGPRGLDSTTDLCIDIHNSTANMGISLIVNRLDDAMRYILWHLQNEFREVHVLYQPEVETQISYLPSIAKRDLTIEVGPQAHGTLRASLFHQTAALVSRCLDLVVSWNNGDRLPSPIPMTLFQQTGVMDYPRSAEGSVIAMIHPSLENCDYQEIKHQTPLFLGFDGKEYLWDGPQSTWLCFIGEAAYLEKRIAFSTLLKIQESW